MSVKSKVKRCNKEIKRLEEKIFELERQNHNLTRIKEDNILEEQKCKLYENIIKFALTNHIGGLYGGMMIDCFGIDKMNDLKLDIENNPMEHAYIIRVRY